MPEENECRVEGPKLAKMAAKSGFEKWPPKKKFEFLKSMLPKSLFKKEFTSFSFLLWLFLFVGSF